MQIKTLILSVILASCSTLDTYLVTNKDSVPAPTQSGRKGRKFIRKNYSITVNSGRHNFGLWVGLQIHNSGKTPLSYQIRKVQLTDAKKQSLDLDYSLRSICKPVMGKEIKNSVITIDSGECVAVRYIFNASKILGITHLQEKESGNQLTFIDNGFKSQLLVNLKKEII